MECAAPHDLAVVVAFRDPELLDVLVKRHRRFVEQDTAPDERVKESAYGLDIAGPGPPDGDGFRCDFGTHR